MEMRPTAPYEEPKEIHGIDPELIASIETVILPRGQYGVNVYLDCKAATPAVKLVAVDEEHAEQIVERLGRALGNDRVDLRSRTIIVRRSKIASIRAEYDKVQLGKRDEPYHQLEVYLNLHASAPRLTPTYKERSQLDAVLDVYRQGVVTVFSYTY